MKINISTTTDIGAGDLIITDADYYLVILDQGRKEFKIISLGFHEEIELKFKTSLDIFKFITDHLTEEIIEVIKENELELIRRNVNVLESSKSR